MCFSVLPIVISYFSVVITKMPDFYFQMYFYMDEGDYLR
jgi:hypothetical protein